MQRLLALFSIAGLAALLTACTTTSTSTASGIAADASSVQPSQVGDTFPGLSLKNAEGDSIDLHELVAEKPAVFVFYRGGWCPYCNKHLAAVGQSEKKLRDLGYQIIAVSPDEPTKLKATAEQQKLGYTLLSDSNMSLAKSLGIAFKLSDETVTKYKTYKIDLKDNTGKGDYLLPVPSVFIVNTDGTITFQHVDPDYKNRLAPEVILAAAKRAK